MPISRYYHGHGSEVMAQMKRKHGEETGERMFYATANKRHENPEDSPAIKSLKRKRRRPGHA